MWTVNVCCSGFSKIKFAKTANQIINFASVNWSFIKRFYALDNWMTGNKNERSRKLRDAIFNLSAVGLIASNTFRVVLFLFSVIQYWSYSTKWQISSELLPNIEKLDSELQFNAQTMIYENTLLRYDALSLAIGIQINLKLRMRASLENKNRNINVSVRACARVYTCEV